MPEQNTIQTNTQQPKIKVNSNIVSAYLSNMFKAGILLAAIVFVFFMLKYITGTNPFFEVLEFFELPAVWAVRAAVAVVVIFLVVAFFGALSLSSYEAVFENGNLRYSYGSFFKLTENTPITNVVSVNFKEYKPFKMGALSIDLSGTDNKSLTIPYVSRVAEKCTLINQTVRIEKMMTENTAETSNNYNYN